MGAMRQLDKTTYEAVRKRANGHCEWCGGYGGDRLQLHHSVSGHGRRMQCESPESCYMLHAECHAHIHSNRKADLALKKRTQDNYRKQGLSDDEIRKRMGGKLF